MREEYRNGIIIGYIVYYNESGNETMLVHRNVTPSVEIKGLEIFTIYWFEIIAFNSIGHSNRSLIVYCKTDQDSKLITSSYGWKEGNKEGGE